MSDPGDPTDIDFASHPHDAYFKSVFSEPAYATDFFRRQLPPAIAAKVDWPGLQVLPNSFVKTSLLYALHCDTNLDDGEILEILSSSETTREQAMTAAQQLIAKGEARGEARGKAEGLWIGRVANITGIDGFAG